MWPQSRCSNFKAEVAAGEEKEEEDKEQCECMGGGGGLRRRPQCSALLDQFCTLEGQERESGAVSGRRKKKKRKKRGAGARMDCSGYSVTETNSLIRCKSAGAL